MHQAFLVCLIWRLYIHANRLFFRSFESFERIFMKNCTSLMTFKQTSNVNLAESNACRFNFYVVTVSGFLIRNKLKMVWRCCYKLSVMFIITKQVESLVMYKLQMIASCTTWSFVAFFSHHKQNEEVFSRVSKDMFANDIIRYIDSFKFFFLAWAHPMIESRSCANYLCKI